MQKQKEYLENKKLLLDFIKSDKNVLIQNIDYNFVMSVVEKIETISPPESKKVKFYLNFDTNNQISWLVSNGYMYNGQLSCIHGKDKLDMILNACVVFVKYYNNNLKQL